MTFTRGEPTVEAGFAADLAEALKAEGVPGAMETCGLFPSISSSVGREAAACRGSRWRAPSEAEIAAATATLAARGVSACSPGEEV